ncbi:MAG: hypothetical protein KatS3mg111_4253 [Pirellulaceae bacterium]|nr:MAG: hypothetical protein KatS3mg111_4253 [Pirellulaceae bacterium]
MLKRNRFLHIACTALWIAIYVLARFSAAQEELPLKDSLRRIHEGLERIRHEAYGNCYLEGTYSLGGNEETKRFRFWSRDNQFFRVDIADASNVVVKRIICRPDGYVILNSNNGALTIADFGTSEKGKESLFGLPFFCDATRVLGVGPEVYFASYIDLEGFSPPPPTVKSEGRLNKRANGSIEFRHVTSSEQAASILSIVFRSIEVPCIESYTLTVNKDGELHNERKGEFAYFEDSAIGVFPKVSRVTIRRYTGENAREETGPYCEISVVDPQPQPLGLFSLEAQGIDGRSVWRKRLLPLAIGLAVLGGFIAYRRMKRHG